MSQFSFTATAFSTADYTSGVENLPPGVNKPQACRLASAENVRFTQDGGIATRTGPTETADLATSAKIDSLMTLPEFGVMFGRSGTKIFQSVDGSTWYDIGVARTAAKGDFLFSHGKDVFATNTTDAFLRIAVSKVTTTFAHTDVEIVVDDITQFAASGKVYIDGDEIDYTGITGSKLTGVTNIATGGHLAGAIITQTSTPSTAPKGSCMTEFQDAALVAAGRSLHASLPSTTDNPEYFYDFNTNSGAVTKLLDSDITALKTGLGVVLVGMKRGMDIVLGFHEDSGAILSAPLSRVHSIPNANCLAEMDKTFVGLTSEGRILVIANDGNGFTIIENPSNPTEEFDYFVQKYIADHIDKNDLSQNYVHYDPASKELTVCVKLKTGITAEIVHQRGIGAWSIDTSRSISCRTNFKGRVYSGSDFTDKIYLENDSRVDAGVPILSTFSTGVLSLARKGITGDFLSLTMGGLLSPVGEFEFTITANGLQQDKVLVKAADMIELGLMSTTSGLSMGEDTLSTQTIGSPGAYTEAYKFTYPYEMMIEAEQIQIAWSVKDEGTKFELRYFDLTGETDAELLAPTL
jgi:hypothetical protein